MGKVEIELDEQILKELVLEYLSDKLNVSLTIDQISIEVKSKQNYRSEWESAAFRARVTRSL